MKGRIDLRFLLNEPYDDYLSIFERIRASSAGTAKEGVPANTTRKANGSETVCWRYAGLSCRGACMAHGLFVLFLQQVFSNAIVFQSRKVIDHHLAIQMVDLVLDTDCHKPVSH